MGMSQNLSKLAEKEFSMPQKDVQPIKKNLDILEGQDKKEFLKGAEIVYKYFNFFC